ncbi:secreted/periplasmic Zn-dependent peptidase, insulinase [Spongiibacter sp. IMCC21906]|uniref:insulinase family protein n=1 Tax=Spongiibacter sp. IMCC21906 TaxID=1620392 RepID=UPI00062DF012|nr:insulinase family protein [Spongiibacter sp. IMCC21906]AKH70326.1 secreted/periplasmic Zn-dependent peptidase, insulinase [Spongiibacter sp. IMCC21906]
MTQLKKLFIAFVVFQVAACSWQPFSGKDENVAKPLADSRDYRFVELDNGLKVLLVSDPNTDKAGASLDVNVGSRQDPADYQGLAHFLEHMLFLGTAKYPRAGEYQEFIVAHGGSHNAFTSFEDTNYFFDISADSLAPALDRFSQFFSAPLFNAEFVQREVNAVNSEFSAKLRDDRRRELSVFKAQLNKNHPFSKFSVGNLQTLQSQKPDALREQLLSFYQRYYSADLMTLTVVGKESLDELEAMVLPRFETIENRYVDIEPITEPLFVADTLPRWLEIEPIQNKRVLSIGFPVPDPQPFWRTKPLNYIGNVLGHEGQGSLLSVLKAKGWAESLSAGQSFSYKGGAVFGLEVNLTQAGQEKADQIVALVFENIRLLREEGVEAWRFKEQRGLSNQQFLFRTPPAVIQDVVGLSMALQEYPAEEVIRGSYVMSDFEPAIIDRFLDALRPDNSFITLVAPGLETSKRVERYKVAYGVRELTPALFQSWKQAPASELGLPPVNPFVADEFDLLSNDNASGPRSLGTVDGVALWLNTDDTYEVPKGRSYLLLQTPEAESSLNQQVKTALWLRMVQDQLNELSYPAQLAGLSFSLSSSWRGIEINIGGYNQKQAELLVAVIDALKHTEWDQARFDRIKAQRLRQFENARKSGPYEQLVTDLPRLLMKDQASLKATREATSQADMAAVAAHSESLLKGFSLTMLVDGNFDESSATALAEVAAQNLPQAKLTKPVQQVTKLPVNEYLWPVKTRHDDAAILQYLQSSQTGNTARVAMGLMAQIMSADFYYQLRTEKQLGYIVSAGVYPIREVPGIYFIVQSPVAGPATLQKEVAGYLSNWLAQGVSPEVFAKHKQSLIKRLAEQPENIWEAADRHWRDLLEHYPEFDSREQLIAALEALNYQQWWQMVSQDLQQRRGVLLYTQGKWPDEQPSGKAVNALPAFKSALPVEQFH